MHPQIALRTYDEPSLVKRPKPLGKGKQHVADDDHVARQGAKEKQKVT
jgi:hypothetical protein